MQPSLQAHTPPMRQTPTSLCWTESREGNESDIEEGHHAAQQGQLTL